MFMFKYVKVLIFGFGFVGYMVVVYVVCVNLFLVLIIGIVQGGQLMIMIDVENWLVDVKGVQGLELMVCFQEYVECFNIEIVFDYIYIVKLYEKLICLIGDLGEYMCDLLIIVIGVFVQYFGLLFEEVFMGKGVLVCVICDGFFYCNQEVVVIGGGNMVVEEVFYFIGIVKKVIVIYCCDKFCVELILIDCLLEK